jgi:hypothetical protein
MAVVGIPLALFGDMDQLPSPRSLIGLVFLLSAILAHIGLYNDIRSVRTASQQWSPRYWWYAVGGALVLLGGLFILDASAPGGSSGRLSSLWYSVWFPVSRPIWVVGTRHPNRLTDE